MDIETSNNDDTEHLAKMIEKVTAIYEKYKSYPYMESKMYNYVCNQLSITLENIERNHIERTQRIEDLTIDQSMFIQSFLFHNRYFYHPTTEHFFYYDGKHYLQYSEDDVIYNILSTISKEDGILMSWKQKTKVSLMKRIKDSHIYQSIPESVTIQHVLNRLYPSVFSTKTEAKYFLTILGDNILRKESTASLIHIISPTAKSLINSLNMSCQAWFGTNACQSFKYKYHIEHNYNHIRLLSPVLNSILNENSLDMLCIACHYSNRYQSSDNYLTKYSNDDRLTNTVLYLKNLTPDILIEMFLGEYIRVTPSSGRFTIGNEVINDIVFKQTQITWKNMYYLWKHFLDSKHLPNVVFTTKLKTRLVEILSHYYDGDQDLFNGIYSKYLPNVCKFLQFWEETMTEDVSEIELEVGEIAALFKHWRGKEQTVNMSEKQIIDIITYFYPEVETDGEKYIYKIRSTLWDKQLDIQMAIDDMKETLRFQAISAYDAYVYYCQYQNKILETRRRPSNGNLSTPVSLLVSKQYFDKYIGTDSLVLYT